MDTSAPTTPRYSRCSPPPNGPVCNSGFAGLIRALETQHHHGALNTNDFSSPARIRVTAGRVRRGV
jgi:hypothetical protein